MRDTETQTIQQKLINPRINVKRVQKPKAKPVLNANIARTKDGVTISFPIFDDDDGSKYLILEQVLKEMRDYEDSDKRDQAIATTSLVVLGSLGVSAIILSLAILFNAMNFNASNAVKTNQTIKQSVGVSK